MKLHIAPKLSLPIEAETETFAIIGKRGVGKTSTAVVLTEELLTAEQHVVVIDPLDAWWGLRSSADGKGPGFPITVLGGVHGDLPLAEEAGAIIADFVVEQQLSVVLSLRHLTKNGQRRFVTSFCSRLYHRKGEPQYRTPLHIMIDEADSFVPQRIFSGQEQMVGAIDDLVRRGRSSGIGVTLITQRAAVIHKDVLTQIEVLVCMRTISPQDRKALETWIEAHDARDQRGEFMESLASLEKGEAWFWSPGWLGIFQRVQVRLRGTFDSSATPKIGERTVKPKQLAPVDLEKLQAAIAATIEKQKSEDPRELRKKIAELERKLEKAGKEVAPADPGAIAAVEKRAYACGYQEARNFDRTNMEELRGSVLVTLGKTASTIDALFKEREKEIAAKAATGGYAGVYAQAAPRLSDHESSRAAIPPQIVKRRPPIITRARTVSAGNGHLGDTGLRRMLIALAQRPGLSAKQVGVRAGLSSSSGTFGTYLGRLRASGWVTGDRNRLEITQSGIAVLGSYDRLPEGRDLLEHWIRELGDSGAARMLRVLVDRGPMSAERLGQVAEVSPTSGTFGTYLGKLRTLELVNGPRGELRASEELF